MARRGPGIESTPPAGGWPNRLYELRLEAGLSTHDIAALADTDASTIVKLQKGTYKLTQDWMRRLAAGLDCHPAELLLEPLPDAIPSGEREFVTRYLALAAEKRRQVKSYLDFVAAGGETPEPPQRASVLPLKPPRRAPARAGRTKKRGR
jgi:transcriptional regulator with XRE-family HTH domain